MATFTETSIIETYQYAIDIATDENTNDLAIALVRFLDGLNRRLDEIDPSWWTLSDRMTLTEMHDYAVQLACRTANEVDP